MRLSISATVWQPMFILVALVLFAFMALVAYLADWIIFSWVIFGWLVPGTNAAPLAARMAADAAVALSVTGVLVLVIRAYLTSDKPEKGKPNREGANETSKDRFPLGAAIGCGVVLAIAVVVVTILVVVYLRFVSTR